MMILLVMKVIFTAGLAEISLAHCGIVLYSVCSVALAAFYIFMVPFGFAASFFLITK